MKSIFSGMQILTDQGLLQNQALVVEAGKITAITSADQVNLVSAKHYRYPKDYLLIPGLIDVHIHGANGSDVMDGTPESLSKLAKALSWEGVTGFLATTMTAHDEQLEKVLLNVANAMQTSQPDYGAAILGVHLEGPFIAKSQQGAQRVIERDVNVDLIMKWQTITNQAVKLITVAPELPHMEKFIRDVVNAGLIVSLGHTQATYDQALRSIEAGSTHGTHLFNAMGSLHQREPGVIGALLTSSQVTAELIVDGCHLHPAIVSLCYRAMGKENIILVTDAMRAKCLGDGCFDLAGQEVTVKHGQARLSNGVLAGSTLTLPMAIKNMMAFTGCSLTDAVYMASKNPARLLSLDHRKGSIAEGKDADLVVMDAHYHVKQTVRGGHTLHLAVDTLLETQRDALI